MIPIAFYFILTSTTERMHLLPAFDARIPFSLIFSREQEGEETDGRCRGEGEVERARRWIGMIDDTDSMIWESIHHWHGRRRAHKITKIATLLGHIRCHRG
jgi:hypothetical protein